MKNNITIYYTDENGNVYPLNIPENFRIYFEEKPITKDQFRFNPEDITFDFGSKIKGSGELKIDPKPILFDYQYDFGPYDKFENPIAGFEKLDSNFTDNNESEDE